MDAQTCMGSVPGEESICSLTQKKTLPHPLELLAISTTLKNGPARNDQSFVSVA